MPSINVFFLVIILATVNYLFTGWFIKYARLRRITDIPTSRSSHTIPTPRGGGIGFVAVSICAFLIYFIFNGSITTPAFAALLVSLVLVSILGWYDDKTDLSRISRFLIHLIAAIAIVMFVGQMDVFTIPNLTQIHLGVFGPLLTLLWLTGVTNIYNFMDGVDGIASVQALSASLGWMIIAVFWDIPILFTLNLVVFATVAAFLFYNWSPAKIFMGDVGSIFLGFFFAVMPFFSAYLSPDHSTSTTIWIGALLLWPFLFDGTYTLFRRILKKENFFEAHRTHLYQRLNISGWSHKKVSTLYLFFSLICLLIALLFGYESSMVQGLILFIILAFSLFYVWIVHYVERQRLTREKT